MFTLIALSAAAVFALLQVSRVSRSRSQAVQSVLVAVPASILATIAARPAGANFAPPDDAVLPSAAIASGTGGTNDG